MNKLEKLEKEIEISLGNPNRNKRVMSVLKSLMNYVKGIEFI